MKVLIACEYSGVVREAFKDKGHDVISCDFLPTEIDGNHYQGDVRDILYQDWDMIIAHPDCTFICNSGVRWLHTEEGRWEKLKVAKEFFKLFLNHPCKKICIENPIPHKYAELPKYSQIIHPHYFKSDTTSKSTCLWLKGLPLLERDQFLTKDQITYDIHNASPSPDRWKIRSRTFKGIAQAMANQWNF